MKKYLSPNGKRVYMVRQILNQQLSYRIVSVPLRQAGDFLPSTYANLPRFQDFPHETEAQRALDSYASQEGLLTYGE